MKILTLVDGSEHSLKALDFCISLLGQNSANSIQYKDRVQTNHQLIILNLLQPQTIRRSSTTFQLDRFRKEKLFTQILERYKFSHERKMD